MLKTNKKKFNLNVSPVVLISATVAILVIVAIVWRFASIHQSNIKKYEDENPTTSSAGAASTQVKNTGFDGTSDLKGDLVAQQVYCDDVVDAAKRGEGAKIRDLCILDEVVQKYLPTLSDSELANLAENHPTCLETGYYEDGYSCFTDLDRNGCGRSGLDAEGKECRTIVSPKNDAVELFTGVPANICDIVSGCQSEAAFGPDGLNEFGCNRQGRLETGELCPAEYITRIYGSDDRDQLGFTRKGFNEFNCDAQGFKEDGSLCPLDQVTRVYDRNSLDQFGFKEDGFNLNNCNIDGFDRKGAVCEISDITRMFDPKTKLDQFNLDKDGFNSKNCNLQGFDRSGERCSLENTPRIFGKDGKDQFGFGKNNRNIYNCDIDGLKPNGDACLLSERTRIVSPYTGKDQFGFFENGRNEFGCNEAGIKPDGSFCKLSEMSRTISKKTGKDANGIGTDGFNENNCNLQGFDRLGNLCSLEDITRIFDEKTGLDQFGLGRDNFNVNGCNLAGFNKSGERCELKDVTRIVNPITGMDQFNFGDDGFNDKGCDINGLNRKGEICPIADITRIIDPKTNLDQFGLTSAGFHPVTGCNLQGVNASGARCNYDDIPKIKDINGKNQLEFYENGLNDSGCDINGRKADGTACATSEQTQSFGSDNMNIHHRDKDGISRLDFNELGFNESNCDIDGRKPDGTLCSIEEITRVYSQETGLDQFGIGKDGFNEYGCNLAGFDRNNNACEPEKITRIFGADMKDQFGNHISTLPESVWLNEKVKSENLTPLLDENGNQVYVNGKPAFVDANGSIRDVNGVALRDKKGQLLTLGYDGQVRNLDGEVVNTFDENGISTTGKLTSKNSQLTPLLDSDGNQVYVNGKPAFVGKDGSIRNADGTEMLDSKGEKMTLSADGKVRNSSGDVVVARKNGGTLVDGPLHADDMGLVPLLDKNGNPVFVNGEAAFVDKDGVVKNANGETIKNANGEIITLDKNGVLLDESGNKITAKDLSGKDIDGPLYAQEKGLSPLLDENGNQVMVNGEPAFVDNLGNIKGKDGSFLLDENGGVIKLSDDGSLRNSAGDIVYAKSMSGAEVSGALKSGIKGLTPLLDENGKQVYVNGKPVFVDKNGVAKNADGTRILDENGEEITLSKAGKLVNSKGFDVLAYDSFGNPIKGPMSSGDLGLSPLLDENGNQVMVNGKPAFVDENGIVRSSSGEMIRGADGEALTVSSSGSILDSKGQRVFATDKNGKRITAPLIAANESVEPLLDKDGNQVMINGKPAFVGKDGIVRNSDGTLMLDKNGEVMTLSESGQVLDGNKQPVLVTDEAGREIKGPFGASGNGLKPLLDENGNQVMINGKPAFIDKNGVVRAANGEIVKDSFGKPYTLGQDGSVYDSQGKKAKITDSFGKEITGPFKSDNGKLSPLLDKDGNPVLVNGELAFVGKDGVIYDKYGKALKDKNGGNLSLSDNGTVKDSLGNEVQATDLNGNKIDGPLSAVGSGLSPLLDKDGNPVYIDGKPAFVDANGLIKDESGTVLTGANGEPLTFNEKGLVVDSLGNAVAMKNKNGDVVDGPFFANNEALEPLLDENGNQVFIDGKPAFVDSKGNIKSADGSLMKDRYGETLKLGDDGKVRDSKNNEVEITNSKGEVIDSPLHSKTAGLSPLLDKNGEPVLINGKPAFVDQNGVVRNANGQKLKDEFGGDLILGTDGQVRDSRGKIVKASKSDGTLVKGALFSANEKVSSLYDENGNPVMVNGSPAFVDKNGVLRDANGAIKKDQYGGIITLGADGKLRDSRGNLVEALNADGEIIDGPLYSADTGVSPLLDANGNPVYIDGKKAFLNEDGVVVDENGNEILDAANGKITLGKDGQVRNSYGQIVAAKDANGNLSTGPIKSARDMFTALLDENGNPVMIDGKKAFIDKDGVIIGADGKPLLDSRGGVMKLGSDGKVRDSSGGVVAVTDMNGTAVTGSLFADKNSDEAKFAPLQGSNGEMIYINGEPAFVDENGNLVDKNNNPILDKDGNPLNLNEYGQVVNSLGQVQPESMFTDIDGEIVRGAMSKGKALTETQLSAKKAAEGLSPTVRRALGLDNDGYNVKGCSLEGLDRNGELCKLEDMPRVFDPETNLDQFGFADDGFNIYGCSFEGLDRNGKQCREEYVTKLFDAKGFNQFNLDRGNFNRAGMTEDGVDVFGCDAGGVNCKSKNTPKLTDSSGADQFGKKQNVFDRLDLVNGFNAKGCGIDGLNREGGICALEDIPYFFNADGVNQFGIREDGFNDFGCNLEGKNREGEVCALNEIPRIFGSDGYDQLNLTAQGRNINGCDLSGFKADGTRCALEEIPRLFNDKMVDQLGLGKNNLNANNCDINGVKPDGTRCDFDEVTRIFDTVTGLDQFLLDENGFNAKGCNLQGVNAEGELCPPEDIPRIYDENNVDQLGFGEDGFNSKNCDIYGYNRQNELCSSDEVTRIFDVNDKDQFGADKETGRNASGCDIDGLLPSGKRCKPKNVSRFVKKNGVDQFGMIDGVNENGCDIDGLDKNGKRCKIEDVTRIFDEDTKLDQLGFGVDNLNEFGCGIDGLDKNGKPCKVENLSHWYDVDDLDQYGVLKTGFSNHGCSLLGMREDGTLCDSKNIPSIFGDDGYSQLGIDVRGYTVNNEDLEGFSPQGCDKYNRKKDGTPCDKYENLNLTAEDKVYMDAQTSNAGAWMKSMRTKITTVKDVSAGSYNGKEKDSSLAATQTANAPVANNSRSGSDRYQGYLDNQKIGNNISAGNGGTVTGGFNGEFATGLNGEGQLESSAKNDQLIQIPAGYMTSINVTTPVNSDYTKDVYATITLGELEGATLIGTPIVPYLDDAVMPRDKFYYEFTKLVYKRQTITIDAVTINLGNDSGMVEADDVNYHRFQRYAGLVVASAVQALDASFLDSQAESDAKAQAETLGELTSSAVVYGQNTRALTQENLKTATQYVSDLAKEQFTRRPTIHEGVGPQMIIFRTQTQDARLPLVVLGID